MPITIKTDEHVAVMTLDEGENRFNPGFIKQFNDAMDQVENQTDATVLVVTGNHEKIFSNGIDLEFVSGVMEKKDTQAFKDFVCGMMGMFKRILQAPMITIVALNGHAFAGGAIMSCYFDFRIMRSDRGFFCFPEVDINIPFLPGMLTAMAKAIPRYMLEDMTLTGSRLTAQQCCDHHIIRQACPIENLMEETMGFARTLNKKRTTVAAIKAELNKDVVYAMEEEDPKVIETGRFYV